MQINQILLIEFEDIELYQYHYLSLYSFVQDYNYDLFEKALYNSNKLLSDECNLNKKFDFKKIESIQDKFINSPWIIPWVDFVNDEFIATKLPLIKVDSNAKENFYFTKSFYLFIEDTSFKKKFFDEFENSFLEVYKNISFKDIFDTYYFFENEKFSRPITFCFMSNIKNHLILRMEVHTFKNEYEDFSQEALYREKNFIYFYNALKGITEDLKENMLINNKHFIRSVVINNLKIYASFCI